MPDTLRIGLGNTSEKEVQNSDTLTLQKKLKNIGFGDISADILERMSQSKEEYDGFLDDIERISQSNPMNQNEKSRIETKYLKGFGQVVNIDGKEYTFYDISKMDSGERRKLQTKIDAIDPDTGEDLKDFLKKLANQRIETKKGVEQAANQEERKLDGNIEAANQEERKLDGNIEAANQTEAKIDKELIDKDKKLKEQIISFEQIKGIQKGDRDELRNSAIQNPPKELEGADKEKLLRGDYDNILLAAHYVTNAESIGKNITDEADRKKFSDSIISMSDTLGRPRQGSWPEISKGLAFGSSRERIVEAGDRAIAGGYNKSVTWNPETRSLIFKGDKGEKVIETAYNPPRERIAQNGLSITRDIPDTKEQKKNIDLKNDQDKARIALIQSTQGFKSLESMSRETGSNMENYLSELYGLNKSIKNTRDEAKRKFNEAKTPEESLIALQGLKASNNEIEKASKDSSFLTMERAQKPETTKIEEFLRNESQQLDKMIQELEVFRKISKQLAEVPRSSQMNLDDWEGNVNKSLGLLNRVGYNILGQNLTDKLIEAINLKKGWKNTKNEIDLNKNPRLEGFQEDEIITGLARLTRVSNNMPSWNGVDPNDRIIADRQLTSGDAGKTALISVKNQYNTNEGFRASWSTTESLGNWLYQDMAKLKDDKNSISAINTRNEIGNSFA